jgi:hypothetical protein
VRLVIKTAASKASSRHKVFTSLYLSKPCGQGFNNHANCHHLGAACSDLAKVLAGLALFIGNHLKLIWGQHAGIWPHKVSIGRSCPVDRESSQISWTNLSVICFGFKQCCRLSIPVVEIGSPNLTISCQARALAAISPRLDEARCELVH